MLSVMMCRILLSSAVCILLLLQIKHCEGADCKDAIPKSQCDIYKDKYYCTSSFYRNWMMKNCRLTCDLCGEVEVFEVVPSLSQWSSWSKCTKTCGDAVKTRTRTCSTGNLLDCRGATYDWNSCPAISCGTAWAQWSAWTSCSATCGKDVTKTRSRECSIKYRKSDCPGSNKDTEYCYLKDCKSDTTSTSTAVNSISAGCKDIYKECDALKSRGFCSSYKEWMAKNCNYSCGVCMKESVSPTYSVWSDWSECSATCDSGIKKKTRKCLDSKTCSDQTTLVERCSSKPCPEFSDWSSWGTCDKTCGNSYRSRSRICQNGPDCTGDPNEIKPCPNIITCAKVVNWSPWGSWGTCSKSCDQGEQMRSRICPMGSNCPGKNEERKSCMMTNCPLYLTWNNWRPCSVTCGTGSQIRTRACSSGGCSGPPAESRSCNSQSCAYYGDWSSWGSCSSSCGDGVHTRSRLCVNGFNCVGPNRENKACKGDLCQAWSEWSPWTSCDASCGDGSKIRGRTCMYGSTCSGNSEERMLCVSGPCPTISRCVDMLPANTCAMFTGYCKIGYVMTKYCPKTCNMKCDDNCQCSSDWSPWTACSASCGGGFRYQEKTCANQDKACDQYRRKTENCNTSPCNAFFPAFDSCSKSCGGGTRIRTKSCGLGSPNCKVLYEDCQTQPCPIRECSVGFIYRYQSLSSCCNATILETCGRNQDANEVGRIIGGAKADSKRWPWMAFLVVGSYNDEKLCGGTLIHREWVITAAHCVNNLRLREIGITFGLTAVNEINLLLQNRRPSDVVVHPRYKMPSNDIALIKLDKPVTISSLVSPICLPNGEVTPLDTKCIATGWGVTAFNSELISDNMNEVSLRILDLEICKQAYEKIDFGSKISKGMICAGRIAGGVDTCSGDSGGPLMCQRCSSCSWYLVGITSWGAKECGAKKLPGLYTNTVQYQDWILSILPLNQTIKSSDC